MQFISSARLDRNSSTALVSLLAELLILCHNFQTLMTRCSFIQAPSFKPSDWIHNKDCYSDQKLNIFCFFCTKIFSLLVHKLFKTSAKEFDKSLCVEFEYVRIEQDFSAADDSHGSQRTSEMLPMAKSMELPTFMSLHEICIRIFLFKFSI